MRFKTWILSWLQLFECIVEIITFESIRPTWAIDYVTGKYFLPDTGYIGSDDKTYHREK